MRRAAAVILCAGMACLGTLAAQDAAEPGAPDAILSAIPAPAGTSQTDKALAEALSKARQTPQDAVAWINLGDALAQVSRDTGNRKYRDLAETAYQRALKLNPQSKDAMVGMAWVENGRGALDRSADWANRALALDENNAAARGIIGDAAMALGDYERASENYQKMMALKPDLSSWSRGATLMWVNGSRSKAIWLMEKAIKADAPYVENNAWCRAKYAMMLFDDGAILPAAQALEPALAAGSRNRQVLLAAGTIAAARHDPDAAQRHYRKALEAGPDQEAFAALGDLCAVKGDKQEAEKYYAGVESFSKANPDAVADPAFMAKFDADHDRNLSDALRFAEAHQLTKNVLEADLVAWIYFKNGDQPHAIAAMKYALSRNTPDAAMQFHAGMIAAAVGDQISAQKHLQQALSYNPHFSVLQAPVAVAALEKLGDAASPADDAPVPAPTPENP